jgi:hypothetical protein
VCVKPSMFVRRQMILVLVTCLLYPDETRPRKEWSPWSSGGNSLHLRRAETSNDPAPCYKRTDVVINPVRGRQIHCLSLEIWTVIWDIHASNYWVTVPAHSPEALCSSEFWSIGLYSRYSRTSIFFGFRAFVTGSDELWACESASPTILPLRRTLSAKSSSDFHELRMIIFVVYGTRPSFSHVMYFMLPRSVLHGIKISFRAFYVFGVFYVLLLVFRIILETNFYIENGFRCSWRFYRSQVIVNVEMIV